MDATLQNKEEQLIEYLRNVLKYQVVPKSVTELRSLVKDAPQKLKLSNYTEENFPSDKDFSELLERFPQYFNFNPDRTITTAGPNYCTLPYSNSSAVSEKPCDEVDGKSCQSDLESDSESSEECFSSEMHKCQIEENAQEIENKLIEFVQNVLKYQIAPMNITALRNVMKDTPNRLMLTQYFEKYCSTDEKFYEFLKRYPHFNFDAEKNISIGGPQYCTSSAFSNSDSLQEAYDDVDGCKSRKEYESDDSESDHEIIE